MAMDGFVTQNTYRSVARAGMLAHGVLSNEYGTATRHRPFPHEFAAEVQSVGVVHGGKAGMNLFTCTRVNSLACEARMSLAAWAAKTLQTAYINTARAALE
jgi:hypothetical protein